MKLEAPHEIAIVPASLPGSNGFQGGWIQNSRTDPSVWTALFVFIYREILMSMFPCFDLKKLMCLAMTGAVFTNLISCVKHGQEGDVESNSIDPHDDRPDWSSKIHMGMTLIEVMKIVPGAVPTETLVLIADDHEFQYLLCFMPTMETGGFPGGDRAPALHAVIKKSTDEDFWLPGGEYVLPDHLRGRDYTGLNADYLHGKPDGVNQRSSQ